MIEIAGPSAWPRDCGPPVFQVAAAGGLFTAMEVGVTPAALTAAGRPDVGFFGSWQEGPLQPPGEVTVPAAAWAQLSTASRLYYRALASSSPDAWVDLDISVPDELIEAAPSVALLDVARSEDVSPDQVRRVWSAAVAAPEVSEVARLDFASAALVRHTTSPRRPVTPTSVQWVVVVAARTGATVRELVCRLAEPGLAADISDDAAALRDVHALESFGKVGERLAESVAAKPERLARRGPVNVWQDLAPPPAEELGGTVLVSTLSGRLLFAATTSWQGGQPVAG